VKTRPAGSMPYLVIKENSRRPFLDRFFSDGGSWLFGLGLAGVLPGWFAVALSSLFIGMAAGETSRPDQAASRHTATLAPAPSGTTNLISGSASTLGSAHVLVGNVYPCALSSS
jgi:hypothetical protein